MTTKRGAPAPAVVGSHFVKQYYGEVLSKKPVELHRFYKDESTFCHASGTKEEEAVSGLAEIKAKIEHLGMGGATVDLGCGSVDAQPSEGGGVLLMVTGSITISDMDPRHFCQTFFLARQHQDNDRHNYFVRNDIFRFLDVLPEVVQAAIKTRDEEEGSNARSPPSTVVPQEDADEAVGTAVADDTSPAVATAPVSIPQASPVAASPVASSSVPESVPSPMAMGAAPACEPHVAAAASAATDGNPAATATLDNGASAKHPSSKVVPSSPAVAASETVAPPAPPSPTPPASSPTPPVPTAPMTYASLAKSWATVAAVGGDVAAPSVSTAGGAPASASVVAGVGVSSGNGHAATPASNGGWGMPDATATSGTALVVEQTIPQPGSGGGQGSARPSPTPGKGQKGNPAYIPRHASPAVAASAAAAREAAAAGNGEILPATSLFVRKVDMTIDRDDMIGHFSAYGDVTGISMNPTRGYAFIDYRTNDCVQSALSTKEHYVNRKLLVVEERHSPMVQRNARGEPGGRGGRNGGRGRGTNGREARDGERGDRRSTGGRGARGGLGRGDRGDGPKEGGYKARGRAEPT